MKITIQNQIFESRSITRLYPAAIVKTGHENETTQMSLEWLDTESKGAVEVTGYGIFVHTDTMKYQYLYKSREELEEAIASLAKELRHN
jgi:hypothetical protein